MNQTLTTDHFRSTVNKIQEQEPHIGVKLDPQAQMEMSISESFGKSTFGKRSQYQVRKTSVPRQANYSPPNYKKKKTRNSVST